MKKTALLGVILVIFLTLVPLITADTDTKYICKTDIQCDFLNSVKTPNNVYYCNLTTGKCALKTAKTDTTPKATTNTTTTTTPAPKPVVVVSQDTSTLKKDITSVKGSVTSLQSDIQKAKTDLSFIKNNIQNIDLQVNSLQKQLDGVKGDVDKKLNTVSTGLAGLQQNVDSAKSDLDDLEKSVDKQGGMTTFIFVLIILGVIGAIVFFVMRKRKGAHGQLSDYITHHTKQGKKLHEIRGDLKNAGWSHGEINSAYRQTSKRNYQQYLQNKTPQTRARGAQMARASAQAAMAKPANAPDSKSKQKVFAIVAVSLVLVIGALLLVKGTVGQAINLGQSVVEETRELTYDIECTGNHTKSAEGICCLDLNQNDKCDDLEAYEKKQNETKSDASTCTDHLECTTGKKCINNKCQVLADLYKKEGVCGKQCNFYSVEISTSDKETYFRKPNQGSYTGAGSMAWTVLSVPTYCQGKTLIPIEVEDFKNSKLIRKRIYALKKFEESEKIIHQDFSNVNLKLKIENTFEQCEE